MRTWATCHRVEFRARGFTLLELLVVLSIMGLAAALVLPAAFRIIGAWERGAVLDDVVRQVQGLPARARSEGRPIIVAPRADSAAESDTGNGSLLMLPEGWTYSVSTEWRVEANGACGEGELTVSNGAGRWVLEIARPFCEASWSEG